MRSYFIFCLVALLLNSCKEEKDKLIESDNFELVKLGDGLYSCIHKIGGKATCNVGIVDNGNETLIFDSFLSPDVAGELLNAVKEMGLSPIKYVVNSHFHNDHIRGNQVFSKEVRIISTTRTKELIEEEEPLQIAYEKKNAPARFSYYDSLYHSFNGDKQSREYQQILMWKPYYEILVDSHLEIETRLPDIFIDSVQHFDGPNRRITLVSKGAGHTESDLLMYLPDDQVIFTGDLVFNERHPYVAHGNISKWKAWLDYMKTLEVNTVMPGHGQIGTGEIIDQMKNYLLDLEISAENLVNENRPIEGFDSITVPNKYKEWWFDRFYEYNLKFAYETSKTKEMN